MPANDVNFITDQFSVGNKLQNFAFYTMLILMLWVVIVQLRIKVHKSIKHKTTKHSKNTTSEDYKNTTPNG
jgi:hypothetical protein